MLKNVIVREIIRIAINHPGIKVYLKDDDGTFHKVNQINVLDTKMQCEDGYFEDYDSIDAKCNLFYEL